MQEQVPEISASQRCFVWKFNCLPNFRTYGSPPGLLMTFQCDVTIAQIFDRYIDCDVLIKKFVNRCYVEPLDKDQRH